MTWKGFAADLARVSPYVCCWHKLRCLQTCGVRRPSFAEFGNDGSSELGSCLTDATREGHLRRAVRKLCRYADARTFALAIITVFWPGGTMQILRDF
jgi:hypothetical protein